MSFNKKLAVILVTVAACIAAAIVIYRINLVNSRYPQRQDMSVKKGEFYEIKPGMMMSVVNAKWMDSDDLKKEYGDVWFVDNPEDYQGVDVRIKIRNQSSEKKKFQLFKIYIESDIYDWNGCVAEFFSKKNNSFQCELNPGQEKEYTMSYTFLKENYAEDIWNNLAKTGYFLVIDRYPVKAKWRIG